MTLSLFLLPPLSLFVVTELTTKVIKDQGRGRAGQGKMGTMAKSWEWDGQMGWWDCRGRAGSGSGSTGARRESDGETGAFHGWEVAIKRLNLSCARMMAINITHQRNCKRKAIQ